MKKVSKKGCEDCKNTGLKDHYNLCPTCNGTGVPLKGKVKK